MANHNPKVNLGDHPPVNVNPHKAPSQKDGLSQKPVAYSGWSHQSVTHGSDTKSSHLTGSNSPTTHGGTSTTHTTSNVQPVKKTKMVDGHSEKIATGLKHSGTSHVSQHTDLQNVTTALSHKYPPASTKNIDQHLAVVKAKTWVSNRKKSTGKSTVGSITSSRVNVATSTKGVSKNLTPTKSVSKVTSTNSPPENEPG